MAITRLNNNSITSITALPSAVAVANTPAFLVQRDSSNQSISASTWTKVQYNSTVYDTDSAYDITTNFRFTVPSGKGGKYYFHAQIYTGNAQAGDRFSDMQFYKNGSGTHGYRSFYTTGSRNWFPAIDTVINLSAGDYVEVFHRQEAGELIIQPATYITFFTGYKLI